MNVRLKRFCIWDWLRALFSVFLIISLVLGFTDPMVALFNSEHSVKMAEYAFTGMRLYVIGFLFAGFNIIGTGYLSASEHAKRGIYGLGFAEDL